MEACMSMHGFGNIQVAAEQSTDRDYDIHTYREGFRWTGEKIKAMVT